MAGLPNIPYAAVESPSLSVPSQTRPDSPSAQASLIQPGAQLRAALPLDLTPAPSGPQVGAGSALVPPSGPEVLGSDRGCAPCGQRHQTAAIFERIRLQHPSSPLAAHLVYSAAIALQPPTPQPLRLPRRQAGSMRPSRVLKHPASRCPRPATRGDDRLPEAFARWPRVAALVVGFSKARDLSQAGVSGCWLKCLNRHLPCFSADHPGVSSLYLFLGATGFSAGLLVRSVLRSSLWVKVLILPDVSCIPLLHEVDVGP